MSFAGAAVACQAPHRSPARYGISGTQAFYAAVRVPPTWPTATARREADVRERLLLADSRLREIDPSGRCLLLRRKHEHVEIVVRATHFQFRHVIELLLLDVSETSRISQWARANSRRDACAPLVPDS